MRRLTLLALGLALTTPVAAAAQDGQRQVIRFNQDSLVLLNIIDPVMGHGVATTFHPQPRAVAGRQGVAFQSSYVVANCDARTIRLGPDTYYGAQGQELGRSDGGGSVAVRDGTLEADLLDVECLNKSANNRLPPMPDTEILRQYLEALAERQ